MTPDPDELNVFPDTDDDPDELNVVPDTDGTPDGLPNFTED